MSDGELLPCPFCGGKAIVTNVRMSGHSFKVGCYNEFCWRPGTDYFSSQDDAIAAWNRRAESALAQAGTAREARLEAALRYVLYNSDIDNTSHTPHEMLRFIRKRARNALDPEALVGGKEQT